MTVCCSKSVNRFIRTAVCGFYAGVSPFLMKTEDFNPSEARRSDHRKLIHHHVDWGIVRADLVRRTGLKRQETKVSAENHCLLINLRGEARAGEDFIEGRAVAFTPRRPGSVIFIPAHHEWRGWDEGDMIGSYLFVSINSGFVERTIGSHRITALKPAIGFRDVTVEACLHRIASELKNPDPISVVMAESQVIQLFVHLSRLNGADVTLTKGGLSPFDLKRVVGLIEERLANPPSLVEMATAIGVSRRHFCRAFKQSTGKAPYTYLADYRMKQAVAMLSGTELTATEIALACGFSSSSHFTFAFRRAFGVSPLEYRRGWRV